MQIKIFTIPILGGEALTEEMNAFLRSRKILQVESHLTTQGQGSFWCFCIKYLDNAGKEAGRRQKVDYKNVLDKAAFERFSQMREKRRDISREEAIPAYAVFTDEELAALAKEPVLNKTTMMKIKGIGKKKVEKYGNHFFTDNEKSESSS